MKYIIEHFEQRLSKWCRIEYKHISKTVGKANLIFANLKPSTKKALSEYGECTAKNAKDVAEGKICLLEMDAEKTLSPDDKFDYLIFGGILGDEPPTGKTKLIKKGKNWEMRNLGKKQMSTDTAVNAAKMITEGKKFEEIKFIDNPEIVLNEGVISDSVIFPFRYIEKYGKPLISKELIEMLKNKKGF